MKELGSNKNEYFISDYLEMMDFYMNDKETQQHLQSSFIIIGRTKEKEMITAITGDVTNFKIEKNSVLTPRFLTIGGTVDGKIINSIYFNNIKDTKNPLDCMKNTILQVSKIDNSVNSNFFYSSI